MFLTAVEPVAAGAARAGSPSFNAPTRGCFLIDVSKRVELRTGGINGPAPPGGH